MTAAYAWSRARLRRDQSVLIAIGLFGLLLVIGALRIDGFASRFSIISMLVLASFLGIAAIGQTLTALVGGIDLSIPFVIGMANIALAELAGERGWPSPVAIVVIVGVAVGIGLLNGLLGWWLRIHPLVITLAVGFAVQGGVQIWTQGNVEGGAPQWLVRFVSVNAETFGVSLPPLVFLWFGLSFAVIVAMRLTRFGRSAYALGDSPVAAHRALVDGLAIWVIVFVVSAVAAAAAGVLLLGFTGGGYVAVGNPYLFLTIAAVVIGGTSLLGGAGGYGLTMLGAAVLTVLTILLVGFGLNTALQQVVLGCVIVVMVALYAREPHPRTQV